MTAIEKRILTKLLKKIELIAQINYNVKEKLVISDTGRTRSGKIPHDIGDKVKKTQETVESCISWLTTLLSE